MSDTLAKCSVCRALLDEEDLFCANCGAAAPGHTAAASQTRRRAHGFSCDGCGASMSYDAQAQALRCPFCGNEKLRARPDESSLAAQAIVPFEVARPHAEAILRQWLGRGFWRPGDLRSEAAIESITPVYVPYWLFDARTFTYWTADTNRTPPGARASWFPITGEHRGQYRGLLVGASSVLTPSETQAIGPFDLGRLLPAEQVNTQAQVVEQFRVPRKYARPLAAQYLEALETQACRQYVPGSARNVRVNVRLEGLASTPVLMPVWVLAYRYKNEIYRFLINGQTGLARGDAPTSWAKVAGAVLIALVVLAAILGMMALAAAAS